MSDLFSRMIARTSGALLPLEPVVASRYEPTAMPDIPALAQQINVVETDQVASADAAEAPQRRYSSRPETHELVQTGANSPAPNMIEERRAAEGLEAREILHTVLVTTPPSEPVLQVETPNAGGRSAAPPVEPRDKQTRPEVIVARAVTKAIEKERASGRQERVTLESNPEDFSSKEASVAPQELSLPAGPPEVNVTIGAIEVRLAAPARPATRRGSSPRVSLDDYLRQRNGSAR